MFYNTAVVHKKDLTNSASQKTVFPRNAEISIRCKLIDWQLRGWLGWNHWLSIWLSSVYLARHTSALKICHTQSTSDIWWRLPTSCLGHKILCCNTFLYTLIIMFTHTRLYTCVSFQHLETAKCGKGNRRESYIPTLSNWTNQAQRDQRVPHRCWITCMYQYLCKLSALP